MNLEDYKPKLEYPKKPTKPVLVDEWPENLRKHADAMEQYNKDLEAYKAAKHAYNQEEAQLLSNFRRALIKECGLVNHPKAANFYEYCWGQGHATGLEEVRSIAHNLKWLMIYTEVEVAELNQHVTQKVHG